MGWLLAIDPGNAVNLFLWLLQLNRAYIPQVFQACRAAQSGLNPCENGAGRKLAAGLKTGVSQFLPTARSQGLPVRRITYYAEIILYFFNFRA